MAVRKIAWTLKIDDDHEYSYSLPVACPDDINVDQLAKLFGEQFYATLCRALKAEPQTIEAKRIKAALAMDAGISTMGAF